MNCGGGFGPRRCPSMRTTYRLPISIPVQSVGNPPGGAFRSKVCSSPAVAGKVIVNRTRPVSGSWIFTRFLCTPGMDGHAMTGFVVSSKNWMFCRSGKRRKVIGKGAIRIFIPSRQADHELECLVFGGSWGVHPQIKVYPGLVWLKDVQGEIDFDSFWESQRRRQFHRDLLNDPRERGIIYVQ